MVGTNVRKLLLLVLLSAGAGALNGCVSLDGNYSIAPDGSADVTVELGVLKTLMELGQGEDPLAQVGEGLAEGKWQQEEFDRDQWHVFALKGHAGPGESLFTQQAEMAPQIGIRTHQFSTRYEFEAPTLTGPMPIQAGGEAEPAPAQAPQQDEEAATPELPTDVLENLASLMLGGSDFGMRFSVSLPGRITETSGELVAPNRAAWSFDLQSIAQPPGKLYAQSRLLNWESVARMATALGELGRYELAPRFVDGIERGVLPDPWTEAPLAQELRPELYVKLLEIMAALDSALGEQVTDGVMRNLGLHEAAVDAGRLARIHERVTSEEFAASVAAEVAGAVSSVLSAP